MSTSHDTQLRMFVAVAKFHSLRAAAEAVGITQPALSRHIQSLESKLGHALFRRHGRGMQLTSDGEALFRAVEPLLDALDQSVSHATAHGPGWGLSLRIATVDTLVGHFVPSLGRELLRIYPQTRLSLQCSTSSSVVEMVLRGTADLGLAYSTELSTTDLQSVELHEERLALYHSARTDVSREAMSRLSELKLVLPPRHFGVRRYVERVLGCAIQPSIECDSLELSLRMASVSGAIALLPEHVPEDLMASCELNRIILADIPARRLVAFWRAQTRRCVVLETAIEIARRTRASER
ncbi:MAG: LysR family transcriptional regulator [Paraburkholderia graminis]|jgi:LysR family transcriptional regulator, transcription activator of glutamate synthase operon|uniref:LysR family transcriptional activator of glutamate synthase operon n=2 Tax=Paraburkholderia graminis TaxID=60548 RepID=A0ABD5CQH3_9BURK|nr:LysR family transcriptional regulator [Paraburkholderia graminis]MDR6207578.1 LysR family transcriptional activator of glutamate synthase operon [Paraburkholderia graminis]